MAKVGTAEYDVEISRAKVQAEVDAAGKQIEQGLGQSAERASREIEDKLSRWREGLGLGVTAGTTLLFKNAIDNASSLAEAQGKARSVFADSYDEVQRFAAGAAEALGQSERQVLDSVGTYGNLLQAMGLSTEQAKEMSIEFVKLGTDLAAFSDVPVEEAIVALRSGLSGETEPLKRFGVNLNQARIEAEAMAQGLWDGEGAIDSAAKAQAAYSVILNDTALAQGTFARESDSAAGQMRIARAETENASASMGQSLLPVVAKAAEVTADLTRAFAALPDPVQTAVVGVGGLTLATGLLWPRIAEGAQVLRAAGARSAEFGKNLIVPKSAVEGLGSATDRTTPSIGKFGKALGALGIGLAVYELYQMGEAMGQLRINAENALSATTDELAEAARAIDAIGTVSFGDVEDLEVLYAMRDAVQSTGGEAIPELEQAITDLEAKTERGAVASAKYGDEVQAVKDEATGAAAAEKDLADATADSGDTFEDAAKAARELYDARRQTAAASERITDAERGVVDAHGRVADAQRSLADAHKAVGEAARGVEDAERDLADARGRLAEASAELAQAQHDQIHGTRELRDAQQEVVDAVAELEQAQRDQMFGTRELADAQKAVINAEKDLAAAQRESKDAQDALNDARKTAAERLRDLEQAFGDSGLDEREARLGLAQARQRLAEVRSDPDADRLAREAAAIAVERAEIRLRETLERNADLEAKLTAEREKGVEGSDEVTAAKERIVEAAEAEEEAQDRVLLAHERVGEVQDEIAARVEAARDRVVEAQERVAEVHEQIAERVRDAQAQVVDAHRGVEDAARRVTEATDGVHEAQQRVVEQREAVSEALAGVEQAERDVIQARIDHVFALADEKEKTDGARAATQLQIDKLGELARTLDPNDPLRRHLEGLIDDLERASGEWTIDVVLGLREGSIKVGEAISLAAAEAALGRRAGGGRVRAGEPYLVGDKTTMSQAEVFVPDDSGVIVPSVAEWRARQNPPGQGRPGGDTFQIDASGIKDPDQLASAISAVQGWRASLEVH